MKRVIIESPYAGDVRRNLRYVRACMRDALLRGEAPFASHALYTQPGVLRDHVPEERKLGIAAGFAWRSAAEATAVYGDLGMSSGKSSDGTSGMALGICDSHAKEVPVERRTLGEHWDAAAPDDAEARLAALVREVRQFSAAYLRHNRHTLTAADLERILDKYSKPEGGA